MSDGIAWWNWQKKSGDIHTVAGSSPESQVRYLRAVVRVKEAKINDQKTEIKALELERALAKSQHQEDLEATREFYQGARKTLSSYRKKPWWRFWRK